MSPVLGCGSLKGPYSDLKKKKMIFCSFETTDHDHDLKSFKGLKLGINVKSSSYDVFFRVNKT